MMIRHHVLFGILLALALLFISTTQYPGGSQHDAQSIGFSWQHNYLSNLLNPVAVNGATNPARPWAIGGVFLLCASVTVFFIRFAKKIPQRSASNIIRYAGVGAMLVSPLAATPLHDTGVAIAGTLMMLALFYATVFVFKTKRHGLKALSVLYLLLLYGITFIYYSGMGLAYLPVLQKLNLLTAIAWVLAMEYGTTPTDFQGWDAVNSNRSSSSDTP